MELSLPTIICDIGIPPFIRTLMLIIRPEPPSPSLLISRIVHSYRYERPAMEGLDTAFLAGIQKSNDLDVYERQFAWVHAIRD